MNFYRTAFEISPRNYHSGRCSPKMPNTIGLLPNPEPHSAVVIRVGNGKRRMRVSSEPRNAAIESPAKLAAIVVEDYVFPVHSAGQPRLRNFNLRFLETRDASVRYGDSPQHGRCEIRRLRNGIDVAGFEFHFGWNAGV